VGETAAATAREIELTRKRMEEKVAKLSERAPDEVRRIAKQVAFAVASALAVMLARKLVSFLWERTLGEPPPNRRRRPRADE
jgi:ribosomal protein L31E